MFLIRKQASATYLGGQGNGGNDLMSSLDLQISHLKILVSNDFSEQISKLIFECEGISSYVNYKPPSISEAKYSFSELKINLYSRILLVYEKISNYYR